MKLPDLTAVVDQKDTAWLSPLLNAFKWLESCIYSHNLEIAPTQELTQLGFGIFQYK